MERDKRCPEYCVFLHDYKSPVDRFTFKTCSHYQNILTVGDGGKAVKCKECKLWER
jgi:hypothetical protein